MYYLHDKCRDEMEHTLCAPSRLTHMHRLHVYQLLIFNDYNYDLILYPVAYITLVSKGDRRGEEG